ncbi:MAG: hypothetical protein LBJ01_00505 [Tannerella sp.]|jgi:hypothetical protein|nr:hypothetical protein [Tannerella sp.]
MDANDVRARAAETILDRGVRYKLGEGDITIRPLRYGTALMIAGRVAEAGLTEAEMQGEDFDIFAFFFKRAEVMLDCVAMAELNSRDRLTPEAVTERTAFYRDSLTAFQVHELFVHVLALSGIRDFTNTIRSAFLMMKATLSPKEQGS